MKIGQKSQEKFNLKDSKNTWYNIILVTVLNYMMIDDAIQLCIVGL